MHVQRNKTLSDSSDRLVNLRSIRRHEVICWKKQKEKKKREMEPSFQSFQARCSFSFGPMSVCPADPVINTAGPTHKSSAARRAVSISAEHVI